jgi:hypothetical protein
MSSLQQNANLGNVKQNAQAVKDHEAHAEQIKSEEVHKYFDFLQWALT